MNTQFLQDVDSGLSKAEKTLSSKYFYDKKGDALFMQIMALPEYYLTSSELEIFQQQSSDIIAALNIDKQQDFDLIELGAGDGSKTRYLLEALNEQNYTFDYIPIDISHDVLKHLQATLLSVLPDLSIQAKHGDYFHILHQLQASKKPKVVLFLGSNIGNLSDAQASDFLSALANTLTQGDSVLLGVDLIKAKDIVLPAYNDTQGVTAAFNLNLLRRINRELGGNFNLDTFSHKAEYNEDDGVAKSFLVSNVAQDVHLNANHTTYSFAQAERIHVEISRKYNEETLASILQSTGLQIRTCFKDSKNYFADFVLQKVDT